MKRPSTLHSFLVICLMAFCFTGSLFAQSLDTLTTDKGRLYLNQPDKEQSIFLSDLKVGQHYTFQITDNQGGFSCVPTLKESVTSFRLIEETEFFRVYRFIPTSITETVSVIMPCYETRQYVLTLSCSNCDQVSSSRSNTSIQVNQNDNVDELMEEFLGDNKCYQAFNFTSKGQPMQFGTYQNATFVEEVICGGPFNAFRTYSQIYGEKGIVMSTGKATNAMGPNNRRNTGESDDVPGTTGDSDLRQLIGSGNVANAVALEFDFIPTIDQASFEYVFASEEYCEYVGSAYNDVFGFFVSGPGINGNFQNGAENIAFIPNQSEYVSINTVNNSASCPHYVKNARPGAGCGEGGQLFFDRPFLSTIEYDGFTTLLTAEIDNLVPCDTYHIKLVIADVTDKIYDSAVFLKANSFNAGGNTVAGVNIQDADDPEAGVAYEGCQQSSFVFTRADNDTSEDLVVNYRVSDESTATPDFDYTPFPTSVTIPAGDISVEVPVNVIADNDDNEGPETIKLEVDQACSCDTKDVEFTIIEPVPIEVIMEDVTICQGGTVNLNPKIEGGFGSTHFDWDHINLSQRSISEVIDSPTSFSVTVTDGCGTTDNATANITIEDQFVSISGSELICNGERQQGIEIELTGSGPWDLTYSRDGVEQPVVKDILESPYILQDSIAGTYEVIKMEYGGCVGDGLPGEAELLVSNLDMELTPNDPSCFNTTDGLITTTIGGSTGNLQYEWNTGSTEKTLTNISAGEYILTIRDENSCLYTDTTTLNRPDEVFASFNVGGKVDCYTPLGATLEVLAEGGNPTYTYAWQGLTANSNLSADARQIDNIGGGDYTVEVTDGNGCIAEKTITVVADTLKPDVKARGSNKLSCKVLETSLSGSGSAEGDMIDYLWTTSDGSFVDDATMLNPTIDQPGSYTLLVTNRENGCQNMDEVAVTANYKVPETFVEIPDTLNCQQTQARLVANIVSPTNDFTIDWTTVDGDIISGESETNPIIGSPGTYSFLVTDNNNGCEEEIFVEVIEDVVEPIVTITSDLRLTCEQQTVTLAADVDLEDAAYTFDWQPANPNSIISNRNTFNPVVDQPGAYALTVQNKDNFCETTREAIVVMDTIKPLADAGASFVFTCDLTTAIINADADQGPDYRYTWSAENNGVIESGLNSLKPTISRSGTYQITVDNRDNGCSNTANVVVTDDPDRPEAIIATPEKIDCQTPSIVLDATASSGGDYTWKNEAGQSFIPNNSQRPIITESGKYTLEITNPDGTCTGITDVVVDLDTVAPVVNLATPETLNCNKTSVRLDGTGSSKGADYNYAWSASDGGTINAGNTTLFPTVSGTGRYALLITNELNGCTKEQDLIVEENVPRALQVEAIDPPCPNDEGQIEIAMVDGGEGPYQYSIDGGSKYSSNTLFTRLDPRAYQVMVMDSNGCTQESTINIEAARPIEIMVDSEMAISLGDSVTIQTHTNLTETEIAYVQWTPAIGLSCDDCMDPIAQPFNSHQYKVNIVDNNGCDASATVNFLVDANPQIYVPTAFSPNNDGFNDRLTIYAKNSVQRVRTFRIFNRWGSLVYEQENFMPNDESMGWDGRFDRQQLRPQVFVYFAEVEMINGEEIVLKGDFALME